MDLRALQKISYGLYVVSSRNNEGKNNGLIVNTVFQVTSKPPTIAVSICKENLTCDYILQSRHFTVSILDKEAQMKFIGLFGFRCGRDVNKFADVDYIEGSTGYPVVLDHALAYLEARVMNTLDAGTHIIFHGEVLNARLTRENCSPMTYEYYHDVKKGTASRNAPTYVADLPKKNDIKEEKKMKKYRCTVCGYIYDPAVGDPESDIEAGTAFDDLPDDWVCPLCGVGKEDFEEVD